MLEEATFQDRFNDSYADLSAKLQIAARFVADNPVDIATRSLRAVASTSGVSPATFSRLARALGYDDYEQMREERRTAVERKLSPYSERASSLRENAAHETDSAMLHHQATSCIENIEALESGVEPARLEAAVQALHEAGTVLLVGSMGSSGIMEYLGYMSGWFNTNWIVVGRNGVELSTTLSRLGANDVVFALGKAPYARRTVAALKAAREAGVTTIAITDERTSPALQFADHAFIVPTKTPHFFPSYTATLVLAEAIISMLLAKAGPDAENMIRAAELQIERLGENWAS